MSQSEDDEGREKPKFEAQMAFKGGYEDDDDDE